uniref:Talin-2 n=1 Tax=Lepeophtheirus salmonis TaxID=72036 RepID=A0A0K2U6E5_LEPSM
MTDLRLRISIIEKNDRDSEVELVRKTLQFKPRTTALDACAQIREHLSEIKSLGQSTQYGLFLPDEDPKKGVWLEPGRTLEHYLLRDNDALEYRRKIRVLKVRMMDGAVKAIMVDDSQIVSNLMVIICTKIGITNHDEYSLVLNKTEAENETVTSNRFGTIGGTLTIRKTKHRDGDKEVDPKMDELKKQLKTEDGVNWVDHGRTLREQGIIESDILLLKRKYFFSDANIDSRDPIQLNLLYEQAREGILDGTHPVTQNVAEEFAALQFQIQFGDYKESTHKSGIIDLKEFLPQSYIRSRNIEKKIIEKHKKLMGLSEVDSKVEYVKLARGLKTFGVHFFLVKEKMHGRNKLAPRLLGVTKDSVLRLDEKTKEILKTWPLTTVRRWAASPNVFTLDFGDYQDQYYSVQTTEGEQISQLIAGYIDIILKKRNWKERIGDDGNEEEAMEEDIVAPGRAITIVGLPGAANQKVEASNVAKPGLLRNSNGASQAVLKDSTMESKYKSHINNHSMAVGSSGAKHPEEYSLTGPQRALVSTISQGQESIHRAETLLTEKARLPPLGNDPASSQWKETQKNTNKQTIHSQVSAMNAATAQMVTLTGQGEETDHNAVGAAVNTISNNLPEMAKGVKLLAALMDDEGADGDDLMGAAKNLCTAFTDLLAAAEPESKEPRQTMLSAASQVGSASHRVLYTIGEEEVEEKERQDILLGLAKAVANTTAALVLKAKNVASKCTDQQTQNKVIGAATQCALGTSQLVACAKVVAPTINDPQCQDQLVEASKEVAKSVEGCVITCRDVCTDESSLKELGHSAADVTRALNDLLNHVKDGHPDRIPDIMEQILTASSELIASCESTEMVRQARILAQSTAELIQAIKGEAEVQSDTDIQKRLLSAAKDLADATARMVEAAKSCASNPNSNECKETLRNAAENLRMTTHAAVGTTIKRKLIKRLENASKHAAASATQCIAASQGAGSYNMSHTSQEDLMDSCKNVAEVIPKLVDSVKVSMQNPDGAMAQINLITNAEKFLDPSQRLLESTKSTLPTINNESSILQLSNSSKQLNGAVKDLRTCITKAHQVCGSLEIEASRDVITFLTSELEEFRVSAKRFDLRPLPGETTQNASFKLNTACKSVGSTVAQLITAASEGNQDITNRAARETANALRDYTAAVRVVAASTDDPPRQNRIIDNAQLVMAKSAKLVLEAQRAMQNPSDRMKHERLSNAGKEITVALNNTVSNLPGQEEISETIDEIDVLDQKINSESYVSSGKPYHELQSQLSSAADKLNEATSDVIQSAPQPNRLVASSKHFGKVLEEMMECSMDMAGQTKIQNTRTSMVSTMRNVTNSSTTFLTSAKNVSTNPSAPNANNLAVAARGVTDSINNLINVYTSAAPGQKECDNAVRAIQSCRHHVQKNSTFPLSNLTYYECLDAVMEKSKALGDGMTGIANHAKKSDHEEFGASVTNVSEAICGLIEAAVQSAYLVGIADINSTTGKKGIVNQNQFLSASQAIKQACKNLTDSHSQSGQEQILSSATVIATHTSAVCNSCRVIASKTTNPVTKRHFVQSAKEVANATATLVKEIKQLDANYTEENHRRTTEASKPLIESMDSLCQFVMSPEFTSVPSKISEEGTKAQGPILESSSHIIEGSCSMIHSAKSLAINPKDPPTWQSLANSSKDVSDSIKRLVSAIRDKSPGQKECEDGIEKLTLHIQELDQISVAAIHQNLTPRRDKDIKQFTEQMENAASQISNRLPELQNAAKNEAERLGHCVSSMMTYFDPLVKNSIGCSSNMVSSKQQVSTLDQTKTVAECAQQLLYAAKEGGGNPKAVHAHADIDESVEAMKDSIQCLISSIEKLAPNLGVVSRIVNCITEAIFTVQDYRTTASIHVGGDSNFVSYQSRMMSSTKEIARTAQEIVIKSTNESHKLGDLASHLSSHYQMLANDSKEACICTSNADMGERIRSTVQELGQSTIELVKSAGSCQITPHDSFSLRDVSDHARNVGEKCSLVLSSLNAASTGTHALENATNTVSGIIGDLDTTIMFASSGTLNADVDDDTFADHRENILKTAKALVEDTKTLVAGAASSQEQLAVAAQNAVSTIIQLSDVVKSGASSLGSPNREAQVMLINAVKDVASALSDLMQSTKAASGKNIQDPSMHQLKDSAKVMVTNVTSLLKTVKAVEDEHTRGTRALESAIEAIAQEIRAYDTDGPPKFKAEPEDLIRATRPITIATGKAASAGKSCKQEDVIVAANMGRKAISDMLSSCKSAAYYSEKPEIRSRALRAGREVAVQYRELLQLVLSSLNRPSGTSTMSSDLTNISRKIAQCVTELATSAELLKDDDWVDPSDPTVIAENELFGAAKSIENAAAKLASLKPRKEVKGKEIDLSMNFDELILDAAKSIAAATAALIKAASEAQKELVKQGKVQKMSNINTEDGQWSEGLVSAARLVAAATHNLCEAANALVKGHSSEEKLIGAAKQVAGSTAQLLIACKVKADPNSSSMKRLEKASSAVRKATDELVKAAQEALNQEEEKNGNIELNKSTVNNVVEEINARSEVLRMERELEHARGRLEKIHQRRYQTDSETEQSGYVTFF